MAYLIDAMPSSTSSDNEWVTWHKALVREIGQEKANIALARTWKLRNAGEGVANTNYLRDYLGEQGIDIDGGVIGNITDGIRGFYSGVGGSLSGFGSMLLIGAIIGIVIIGFMAWKGMK